ncbi:MAG TPA: hypothetical protein VHN14_23135 [Kofleriaceae bacterium]|jgi:hypothetical protein|nr:hypothetical protein [Kofleriaceae bacterium]
MIWLKNYNSGRFVLEYDPATGKAIEVARDLARGATARGFYVAQGHDLIGVFASPAGPVFFVNRDRYPMKDPTFGVEHQRGDREHRFIARRGGAPVYELRYPRRTDFGQDNWTADEESADWFLWLAGSAAEPQFYSYYTAPLEPARSS